MIYIYIAISKILVDFKLVFKRFIESNLKYKIGSN